MTVMPIKEREVSKIPVQAKMLRIDDVGRTVVSKTYMDARKSTKPSVFTTRDGKIERTSMYTIESIYVHRNGTILINQNGWKIYLRPDTDIFFVYEDTE